MSNPTMLYKHPGIHKLHGDLFDYCIVEKEDIEAAVKDGWCLTTTEAKEAFKAQTARKTSAPSADESKSKPKAAVKKPAAKKG
jgi:hypothetical protein